MLTICDTHALLFWEVRLDLLTLSAQEFLTIGKKTGHLAWAATSLWGKTVLFRKNRLILPPKHTPVSYMEDIVMSLELSLSR